MRISDWSSDVCSSDLREVGPAQLEGLAVARHGVIAALLGERDASLDQQQLDLLGKVRLQGRQLGFRFIQALELGQVANLPETGARAVREIGRASCRERVCRYG